MKRAVRGQARRSIACFRNDTKRSVVTITWSKTRVCEATNVPQFQSKVPNENSTVRLPGWPLATRSVESCIEASPNVIFSEENTSKVNALLRLRHLMAGFHNPPSKAGLRSNFSMLATRMAGDLSIRSSTNTRWLFHM